MYRDHLTADEQMRMFGTVQGSALDRLVEESVLIEGTYEALANVDEALGCFIEEDFLSLEILELKEWLKSKRGQNKAEFQDLIGRIEQAIKEALTSAEHGAAELKQAKKTIVGAD